MNKYIIHFIIIYIELVLLLGSGFLYLSYKGSCNMDVGDNLFLNGVYYFRDEYYCVSTKLKTTNQIANTDEHEKCHALIDKDFEHFCDDWIKELSFEKVSK